MRSSIISSRTKRIQPAQRYLALLLVALLLSMFASPPPQLAALTSSLRDQNTIRASASMSSNSILPALDPHYELEGVQTAKL